jgi:exosortase
LSFQIERKQGPSPASIRVRIRYHELFAEEPELGQYGYRALMQPMSATHGPIAQQWLTLHRGTELAQAGVIVLSVVALYSSVIITLVMNWWTDPNFSHGFFVPAFSAYVVWVNRKRLAGLRTEPSWSGLLIIALAMCMLVVGVLGAELFLSRSSLVILIAGLVVYLRGWRCFRAVSFPWICLFLMIPIPALILNKITFPMQLLASRFSQMILAACGIPVLREGNILLLPSMSLEVAQACSGIRSLMTLVTLAVVYSYLLEASQVRRVLLVIAAVPIAIAANSLRIVVTGLMVQHWGPEMAEGFLHTFEGLIMIGLALLMFLFVHTLMHPPSSWFRGKLA